MPEMKQNKQIERATKEFGQDLLALLFVENSDSLLDEPLGVPLQEGIEASFKGFKPYKFDSITKEPLSSYLIEIGVAPKDIEICIAYLQFQVGMLLHVRKLDILATKNFLEQRKERIATVKAMSRLNSLINKEVEKQLGLSEQIPALNIKIVRDIQRLDGRLPESNLTDFITGVCKVLEGTGVVLSGHQKKKCLIELIILMLPEALVDELRITEKTITYRLKHSSRAVYPHMRHDAIQLLLKSGMSYQRIAKALSVSRDTVYRVSTGKI